MTADSQAGMVRIGELSRRLGVSAHVLRAWERRYGLLRPTRSPGGFRLYSAADENRVRRMQAHLGRGLAAAEAARAALAESGDGGSPAVPAAVGWSATGESVRDEAGTGESATGESGTGESGTGESATAGLAASAGALRQALDEFDEPAAQAALDRLFAAYTVESVLRDVVLPYLHDLGERWAGGTVNVAEEHFASNLLRARLAALARGWGRSLGPLAVLACPPGELHDLPLLAFGVVLHRAGWRVAYLGADTPLADLRRTVTALRPHLVVLAAVMSERFAASAGELARLAGEVPLAIAGAGATPALAQNVGARLLTGDPVTEALRLPSPGVPG